MNIQRLASICLVLALAVALSSCGGDDDEATGDAPRPLTFTSGFNKYSMEVDGASREFIVYVPSSYTEDSMIPVVVMAHGTSQSGAYMAENSGWAEKAEKEGILAVFPTALRYFLVEENRRTTKWSSAQLPDLVAPGTEIKDDVNFMRRLVEVIRATWNTDTRRTFMTGFSNGAAFTATRVMIEMPDVFAAFATAGGGLIREGIAEAAGPLVRERSHFVLIGTSDDKMFGEVFATTEIKKVPDEPEAWMNGPMRPAIDGVLSALGLTPEYAVQRSNPLTLMTFSESIAGGDNEFRLLIVDGLFHIYPHDLDTPESNNLADLYAPDLFWEFFQQHPLN